MGFFSNLLGITKLKIFDSNFGEIESVYVKGEKVWWKVYQPFFGKDIEILMDGNKEGISPIQKQILISALQNQTQIKSECEIALREELSNASIELNSIDDYFNLIAVSTTDKGFSISFEEMKNMYVFNVYFENNKQVSVSMDS